MAIGTLTITTTDIVNDLFIYTSNELARISEIETWAAEVTAEAVAIAGNQTVANIKTFTSSPVVPTPTTDMQASTKKYVDDRDTATATVPGTVQGFLTLASETKTISSGSITITKSFVKVDTEGDGATDDLTHVVGGSAGSILILQAADSSHSVVIKDNAGEDNCFMLTGDVDFTLDHSYDKIMFIRSGDIWSEISRSGAAA